MIRKDRMERLSGGVKKQGVLELPVAGCGKGAAGTTSRLRGGKGATSRPRRCTGKIRHQAKAKRRGGGTQGTKNEGCEEGPPWPQVELTNLAKSELFLVPGAVVTLNSIPILRPGFPVIPSVAIHS